MSYNICFSKEANIVVKGQFKEGERPCGLVVSVQNVQKMKGTRVVKRLNVRPVVCPFRELATCGPPAAPSANETALEKDTELQCPCYYGT